MASGEKLILCESCARARGVHHSDDWEHTLPSIAAGHCEDCSAGFCLCNGARWCGEKCPRRTGSVIVAGLSCYRRAA